MFKSIPKARKIVWRSCQKPVHQGVRNWHSSGLCHVTLPINYQCAWFVYICTSRSVVYSGGISSDRGEIWNSHTDYNTYNYNSVPLPQVTSTGSLRGPAKQYSDSLMYILTYVIKTSYVFTVGIREPRALRVSTLVPFIDVTFSLQLTHLSETYFSIRKVSTRRGIDFCSSSMSPCPNLNK